MKDFIDNRRKQTKATWAAVGRIAQYSLFVVLVVLEVIHQTSQQVDLRQIEQSVVHIDPAEDQVEKIE